MNCRKVNTNLADLLLDPQSVPAEVRNHVAECGDCAAELAALQATMKVMEEWSAPEPGPFFDARLFARLREEASAPTSRWERFQSWFLYGSRLHVRQLAAAALVAVLAIGGGAVAMLEHDQPAVVPSSATIRDLQAYDSNAQLFQQLNALDASDNDAPANGLN